MANHDRYAWHEAISTPLTPISTAGIDKVGVEPFRTAIDNPMSKLTTQDMIAIATDTKKAQAALAFRMSGMATTLTDSDRKTVLMSFKVSPQEKERYQTLSRAAELNLSTIIRTLLDQACNDLEVS